MPDLTPDPAAREAAQAIGDSIADNLGQVFGQLADILERVIREQAELRDELHGISKRLDAMAHYNTTRPPRRDYA